MRFAPELDIPEVKPAIELLRGRRQRKMSPQTRHAQLQGRLLLLLGAWGDQRGIVGTEWRFYLSPQAKKPSSLVPDVAFVSTERLPGEPGPAREKPAFGPDIAAEVLSPGDRRSILLERIELFFEHGTRLVIVADPKERTVTFYEDGPAHPREFRGEEIARSRNFATLDIDVSALFAGIV